MTNQPNTQQIIVNDPDMKSAIFEAIDMQIEMELDAFIAEDNFDELEILLDILTEIGYAKTANNYRRAIIRELRSFTRSLSKNEPQPTHCECGVNHLA